MNLRAAAEQIRAWLADGQMSQWRYMESGDFYADLAEKIALLDAALAAEQPQPEAQPVAVVTECEACFTPDVCQLRGTCDYYSAEWLRVAPPPAAPEPSEAELPPLPIGEAEVVWHEPDPVMPERPGKIIDASMAFFDAAPLGTHLFSADQMRDYALRAAAAARGR